jgi:hypothetical protein
MTGGSSTAGVTSGTSGTVVIEGAGSTKLTKEKKASFFRMQEFFFFFVD